MHKIRLQTDIEQVCSVVGSTVFLIVQNYFISSQVNVCMTCNFNKFLIVNTLIIVMNPIDPNRMQVSRRKISNWNRSGSRRRRGTWIFGYRIRNRKGFWFWNWMNSITIFPIKLKPNLMCKFRMIDERISVLLSCLNDIITKFFSIGYRVLTMPF